MATEAESKRAEGYGRAADLARLLGVSAPAVKQAIDEGRVARGADYWIHLARGAASFRGSSTGPRNGIGGASNATATDDGEILASAQARKACALADLAELRAAQARSKVVSVADARATWYALCGLIRERVLALPDAVVGELALSVEQTERLRAALLLVLLELPQEPPMP